MLPRDPIMLLSYVNTQLRDRDASWTRCVTVRRLTVTRCVRPCARSAMSMTLHRIALCDADLCEV